MGKEDIVYSVDTRGGLVTVSAGSARDSYLDETRNAALQAERGRGDKQSEDSRSVREERRQLQPWAG